VYDGGYFNEIVQREPMLASQETESPTKKEAKIDAVDRVRSSVAVKYTPSNTSLWIR
jgi:hypothetical protein